MSSSFLPVPQHLQHLRLRLAYLSTGRAGVACLCISLSEHKKARKLTTKEGLALVEVTLPGLRPSETLSLYRNITVQEQFHSQGFCFNHSITFQDSVPSIHSRIHSTHEGRCLLCCSVRMQGNTADQAPPSCRHQLRRSCCPSWFPDGRPEV